MKLSPNVTDITEMARAAEAGGADVVSLINTITGMKIDINRRTFAPVSYTHLDVYKRQVTAWPSSRDLKPSPLIAEKCTNTSAPSSPVMKP